MGQATYLQIGHDLDRMAQMSCALEAYGEILRSRQIDFNSPTGHALTVGLEAIDPNINLREGSAVTLRAIKEGLIKLAKMVRAAVRTAMELIQSLYVKFTGSLGVVRGRQKKIGAQLGRLGNKVIYKKMEINGIDRLCVNGEFVGNDVTSLQGIKAVTQFVLDTYPSAVSKVSRDSSRKFLELVENSQDQPNIVVAKQAVGIFGSVLQAKLQVPASFTVAQSRELPPVLNTGSRYYRSPVMPGNMALVFTHPQDIQTAAEKANAGNYASLISSAFACRFIELPLNTPDRGVREVEVPTIAELNALYLGISAILDIAERGESGVRDFATVKNIVDDSIRQVAEQTQDVSNANNVVIHMLGSMSERLGEPMGPFTHWLAITLNVYLGFMAHCIQYYQSEGV